MNAPSGLKFVILMCCYELPIDVNRADVYLSLHSV